MSKTLSFLSFSLKTIFILTFSVSSSHSHYLLIISTPTLLLLPVADFSLSIHHLLFFLPQLKQPFDFHLVLQSTDPAIFTLHQLSLSLNSMKNHWTHSIAHTSTLLLSSYLSPVFHWIQTYNSAAEYDWRRSWNAASPS